MALTTCPDCGKEISDKATQCIHCGCPIEQEGDAPKDKIREINGVTVNIDELIRESRGNDEAMANRLRSLTGVSRSEAKRITGIAFKNRNIEPMGFFRKVSERTVVCPKCGSRNVTFTVQQSSSITRTKEPGALWGPGRSAMKAATFGLWGIRGKRKETSSTSFTNQNIAICQDCGKKWNRL